MTIEKDGAAEIARRARGTPRIANRLLRRVRDYAQIKFDGRVTREVADAALAWIGVDTAGFDEMDRKLLLTIIEKFTGGPGGVDSPAAALGQKRETPEGVSEPYLSQAR